MKSSVWFAAGLGLLAACSSSEIKSGPDRTRAAVEQYLRANLPAPAGYEPVRWGSPKAYTRRDSTKRAGEALLTSTARQDRVNGYALIDAAGADTASVVLGTQISHTYRRKDAAGTVALDSGTFVVYKDGRVMPPKR